jgi:hypothetical integral membrane protein (TIGR02206 family)
MTEIPFTLFGGAHIAVLILILAGCWAVARRPPDPGAPLVQAAGWALIITALIKPIAFIFLFDQPWQSSLPFDLCRINEVLTGYLLLTRSYRVFEVAYFLAVAGSGIALLTPDLLHGFPDLRFLLFFISHGLSVLAVVYALSGFRFRPTLHSVGITLAFLAVYTLIMAFVNLLLDANYLFLREKPQGASVLDLLGPWPYYLIWEFGLAILLCLLCYLPFALKRFRQPR